MSNWPNHPEPARPAAPAPRAGIGPAPEPRRRRGLGIDVILLTIAGAMALAYGVKVLSNPSAEISEWHYAAALEKWADGDREAAIASLSSAIEWNAAEPYFYVQRAEWRRQVGSAAEALTELDAVIEKLGPDFVLLAERVDLLQRLGRHAEVVKVMQSIRQQAGPGAGESRTWLNGIAYMRAVAKIELDEALVDVNRALAIESDNPNTLDTRGFILYQQGKYSEALSDLDAAVRASEKLYSGDLKSQETLRRQQIDVRAIDEALVAENRHLAVIVYHRGLALEALGRREEAAADFARARDLAGKEPDETLF